MNAPINPTEIDRLVDGELDPVSRRDLLLRLDASPDGWRRCALAFLEAREFAEVARAWTREHAAPAVSRVEPRRRPSAAIWAMAASVLGLAFLSGFAARGWATSAVAVRSDPPRLLAETKPARPAEVETSLPAPDTSLASATPPGLPEYVKAQWSRLGYQVEPSRRVISIEEGGRRETFPVDDYRVEFVGRPTY
jgi:hypothetical protein